jgi:transposase
MSVLGVSRARLAAQSRTLTSEINRLEAQIRGWRRIDESQAGQIRRLTASAIAAAAPDASLLRSSRQFAAWVGLTPHAKSLGDKERPAE